MCPWLTSGLTAVPVIDFHVPYLPPQTYFFTMSTPATTVTSINPTVARIIGTEFDLEFLINENTHTKNSGINILGLNSKMLLIPLISLSDLQSLGTSWCYSFNPPREPSQEDEPGESHLAEGHQNFDYLEAVRMVQSQWCQCQSYTGSLSNFLDQMVMWLFPVITVYKS